MNDPLITEARALLPLLDKGIKLYSEIMEGDKYSETSLLGVLEKCKPTIASLLKELEACRADALRYRWLRHGDHDELVLRIYDGSKESRVFDPRIDSAWLPRNQALDAAIDAAISTKEQDK